MFGLMNKLTGTRVPTIVGIYYHYCFASTSRSQFKEPVF